MADRLPGGVEAAHFRFWNGSPDNNGDVRLRPGGHRHDSLRPGRRKGKIMGDEEKRKAPQMEHLLDKNDRINIVEFKKCSLLDCDCGIWIEFGMNHQAFYKMMEILVKEGFVFYQDGYIKEF
jgi:hypothetical protein